MPRIDVRRAREALRHAGRGGRSPGPSSQSNPPTRTESNRWVKFIVLGVIIFIVAQIVIPLVSTVHDNSSTTARQPKVPLPRAPVAPAARFSQDDGLSVTALGEGVAYPTMPPSKVMFSKDGTI